MAGHHLILGRLTDFLTGKALEDTHDERHRQAVAQWLVERKAYNRTDLISRETIKISCEGVAASIPLDFRIEIEGASLMIVKYGPGSIVTRHRPALALSRLATPYQIPVVVITNGLSADILSGEGQKIGEGFAKIPDRSDLTRRLYRPRRLLSPEQLERKSRILYAYEVDDACFCDTIRCGLTPDIFS